MRAAFAASHHRRRKHLLIVLLLASVVLTACGVSGEKREGAEPSAAVLRIGTEGTYTPFSYHEQNGSLTGYDVDVARAVGLQLGVTVEFVETPWDSIFAALGAHRFDLIANQVTVTDERKKLYDFSAPYAVGEGVIVARADDQTIHSVADLRGKVAAATVTSNWAQVVRENGARSEPVEGFAQAIKLLSQRRVDVVVIDSIAANEYLARTGDESVKIAGPATGTIEIAFAARQGSGLMPRVNEALAELRNDGTLASLSEKYLKTDVSGAPARSRQRHDSGWKLIARNLWPLAKAAITVTIPLTILSFAAGLVVALGVALARLSANRTLASLARLYVSVIRGTPLLVQLFIVFYALPDLGIELAPFVAAVIAFSLNVGGYAAEIIRSAIQSIPKGQWEAAETIGLDYVGTLRRIVLPQAARVAVPPLSNTLVSLVKDTSLASTILVTELFRKAQETAAPTFEFFALYGTAAVYYWIICLGLAMSQSALERRFERFVAR